MDGLDEARRTVDDMVVLYGPDHPAAQWAQFIARQGAALLGRS